MLANVLQAHPEVYVSIEPYPIFRCVTLMALDPRVKSILMPKVIEGYREIHKAVAPRHYADKSHPNIWHAEDLATQFPEALFLGIQRNPYATVASMLRHPGVRAWHDRWRQYPVPNSFLGITLDNQDTYDLLEPEVKCALRWKSHATRMNALRKKLGGRLFVTSYERLILDRADEVGRITKFLGLSDLPMIPEGNIESVTRWQKKLPVEVQTRIASVTGVAIATCLDGKLDMDDALINNF